MFVLAFFRTASLTRHKRFVNGDFIEILKEEIEARAQLKAVLDNLDIPVEIQALVIDALANLPTNIDDVIPALQNLLDQLEAGDVEQAKADLALLVPPQLANFIEALLGIRNK